MMKRLIVILAILPAALFAQMTYVPDDNFEKHLIIIGLDTPPLNDSVPTKNIDTLVAVDVSYWNIADLTGIEDFSALEYLNCSYTSLTSLDVSKNSELSSLYCNDNALTSLDVSRCIALKYLHCEVNALTSLDVSKNSELLSLYCNDNRDLYCIQVADSSMAANNSSWHKSEHAVWSEDCSLVSFEMTYVPDNNFEQTLINLGYDTGALNDSVPTKNIDTITVLNVQRRNIYDLTGIEDFSALTYLDCSYNGLTSLDVSRNSALTFLWCSGSALTSLDISGCSALTYLNCSNTSLTGLDVSKNSELTRLDCNSSALTSLDVSKNFELTKLYCNSNALTGLDVSGCTALTYLDCSYNGLKSLDVSKNTALTVLKCSNNALTNLDVSKNSELTSLYCYYNNLSQLDVSKNSALKYLHCQENVLTSLDVSKNSKLSNLYCYYNRDLYCIQVTDSSKAANNSSWQKDNHAIWSEDCSLVSVEETSITEKISISPNPAGDYIEVGGMGDVKIYDLLGIEHPATAWHPSVEGNVRIDVSALPKGVYFVKVGGKMLKFIKI